MLVALLALVTCGSGDYFVDVAIAEEAPVVVAALTDDVFVLDAEDGKLRARLELDARKKEDEGEARADVWALDVDPAGELAAALLRSGELLLFDLEAGGEATEIRALGTGAEEERGWRFGSFVEFDPTGERLLVGTQEGGIVLLSRAGERVAEIEDVGGSWFHPGLVWNATGARFAYCSGKRIHVRNGRTGAPIEVAAEDETGPLVIDTPFHVNCLAFHPSSEQLASGHDDGRIRIWDLATRQELARYEHVDPMWGAPPEEPVDGGLGMTPYINWLSYSHDGKHLAYTTGTGVHLGVFDVERGERIGIGPFSGGRMGEPAEIRWAPDDRTVWYGFVSGVMPLQWMRFGPGRRYHGPEARGTVPVFGHEGRGVYTVSGGGLRVIDSRANELLWERTPAELTVAAQEHR